MELLHSGMSDRNSYRYGSSPAWDSHPLPYSPGRPPAEGGQAPCADLYGAAPRIRGYIR